MGADTATSHLEDIPPFGRRFFDAEARFTRIGSGSLGGKAASLAVIHQQILPELNAARFPGIEVAVPTLTVLTTDVFESFMRHNDLYPIALSDAADDRIAHAFQKGELPAEYLGDLRALIAKVHTPLAVRSSSRLEDALEHPFAGVYATKMIPNNQVDVDTRFLKMVEAIKFVFASTFFRGAKDYLRSINRDPRSEAMAVIIQEVVGTRFGDRFYPEISGVARSFSYYPTERAKAEDGVVNLALGLGKMIVDGGTSWYYSPTHPSAPPPFNNIAGLLKNTQTKFWAVHIGKPPLPDPIRETEYLVHPSLEVAEADGTLEFLASTYDAQADRVYPGLSRAGPRIVNFAPILDAHVMPLNEVVKQLLEASRQRLGTDVEIEFAATLDGKYGSPARLGFLQLRPMMVSSEKVEVKPEDLYAEGTLVASESVIGNGARDDITDVVFVKPGSFDVRYSPQCALQLGRINQTLREAGRPYLLLGFGRWGSSDRWLGVPVDWSQISQARVIVEATRPDMNPESSQGSHFFHNLIAYKALYLTVRHSIEQPIDWDWLDRQETVQETELVRHVRTRRPLKIRVDSRSGRGVIRYDEKETLR